MVYHNRFGIGLAVRVAATRALGLGQGGKHQGNLVGHAFGIVHALTQNKLQSKLHSIKYTPGAYFLTGVTQAVLILLKGCEAGFAATVLFAETGLTAAFDTGLDAAFTAVLGVET